MGYISIQINKAKGSADTGASDHIERKTTPKNADPTRTHLNRELVQFPDGVADRHAYQRQAAVLRGRTLLGGTQTEVHDREGRLPSGERPGGQIETCACHQWATDWRMVQGAI